MPSRHSSSSHSSSRSSSHSSHSFSGGSRSFSFHSRSSASSSYDSYDVERRTPAVTTTKVVTQYVTPQVKTRVNQPTVLPRSISTASLFRSIRHDYFYLPETKSDETSGKTYKQGFYDENGNYYKQVIVKKGKTLRTQAACSFCGTQIKLKWEEGALPSCPNCGAALSEILTDAVVEEEVRAVPKTVRVPSSGYEDDNSLYSGGETYTASNESRTAAYGAAAVVLAVTVGGLLIGGLSSNNKNSTTRTRSASEVDAAYSQYLETATPTPTPIPGYYDKFVVEPDTTQPFYVEAIQRECSWHNSGNYYDKETDCYFWLNTEVSPPVWQYWYEGISSEFGDYGWMEYSFVEQTWYIEAAEENWIPLPEKYDTSNLWHMNNPDDGRFQDKDQIFVEEIERICDYIPDENNYYDPQTRCHFYYDTFTGPGFWCYWFEPLYEAEGTGWMWFDETEGCWYVEDTNRWYKLPEGYYTDQQCWHIKKDPT